MFVHSVTSHVCSQLMNILIVAPLQYLEIGQVLKRNSWR